MIFQKEIFMATILTTIYFGRLSRVPVQAMK